jgi:1-phosphofructokinase family hexose kinase
MLLVITPNPAIDRVLEVPGFRVAEVCRVTHRRDGAGGKGLNVARVARTLGLDALVVGPLGGTTGHQVARLAAAEGIAARWHRLEHGETRICVLVTDQVAHDTLTINEPGPTLDQAAWQAFAAHVRSSAEPATLVALSGSVPPGVTADAVLGLLATLEQPVALDSSGAVLAGALERRLALVKVNLDEFGAALGVRFASLATAAAAARLVCRHGPHQLIITHGQHGAIASDAVEQWHAAPPALQAVSPVGSGDAVLAGALAARTRGAGLAEALRLGVACGAANVVRPGPGVIDRDDVARLTGEVVLRRLG